jgi:hypothetical protein
MIIFVKIIVKINVALRERYVISKSNAQFSFRLLKLFIQPGGQLCH